MKSKEPEEIKNYFVAIYNNYEALKLSDGSGMIPKSELKYFIKCDFYKQSSSGLHNFYKNYVYDSNLNRIEENIIEFDGLLCMIKEEEQWNVISGTTNALIISTTIKDRLGIEKLIRFYNANHDGSGFKSLLEHLSLLNRFASHNAVDEYKIINKEMVKKDEQIKILSEQIKRKKKV